MSVPIYPEQEKAPVAETTDAPWAAALPDELASLASSVTMHDREPIPDLRPMSMVTTIDDHACGYCGGQGIICLLSKPPKYQDCPVCHGGSRSDPPNPLIDFPASAATTANLMHRSEEEQMAAESNADADEPGDLDERAAAASAFSYDDPETVALITGMRQQVADLEAKLDAERTLRAQASAELEREKARERDRRLEADAAARDRLWAIDALVEALVPMAGYATEEDGRVAGMTSPVCLAMSSVRRADALVKLHRALRR